MRYAPKKCPQKWITRYARRGARGPAVSAVGAVLVTFRLAGG
jgi:hypothetical protein